MLLRNCGRVRGAILRSSTRFQHNHPQLPSVTTHRAQLQNFARQDPIVRENWRKRAALRQPTLQCDERPTPRLFYAPEWELDKRHSQLDGEPDPLREYGVTPEKWEYYNKVVWSPNYVVNETGLPKAPEVFHSRQSIHFSPKRMWQACQLVWTMNVDDAILQLKLQQRKGCLILAEVLEEAKKRAAEEFHIEYPSEMHVAEAFPVQSNIIKGARRHARENWHTVRHRYIHLFVRLEAGEGPAFRKREKPNGGWDHMRDYYSYLSDRSVKYGIAHTPARELSFVAQPQTATAAASLPVQGKHVVVKPTTGLLEDRQESLSPPKPSKPVETPKAPASASALGGAATAQQFSNENPKIVEAETVVSTEGKPTFEQSSDDGSKADGEKKGHEAKARKRRERMARNTKLGMFAVFGTAAAYFAGFCVYYGRSQRDEAGNIIVDEFTNAGVLAPFYRIVNSIKLWKDYVVEPAREKLLPDPMQYPYIQPKYTLVIEMKNVLVAPEWTYKTGYRFIKRPALDYFLDIVGYPNFEVVIYTSESNFTGPAVVDAIDPKQRIMFKLYRDCTKYMNGVHVKDLSKLNRDLSKVIYIDFDPASFQLNPDNVLRLPKWDGDMNDTALLDLAELLKTIHLSDVEDVRPTLQYYSSFDNPATEFRRRAMALAEQEEEKRRNLENKDEGILKRYSGRLFGYRRHEYAK
ncbi:unnamed protein product, partial [Mesorhabditis spiculigera]